MGSWLFLAQTKSSIHQPSPDVFRLWWPSFKRKNGERQTLWRHRLRIEEYCLFPVLLDKVRHINKKFKVERNWLIFLLAGGSIPGSGRSPGEGNGYPLQYSYLENPMDRRAWLATVHEVTKCQTQLNNSHFHFHIQPSMIWLQWT